jgi:hypothetical protein
MSVRDSRTATAYAHKQSQTKSESQGARRAAVECARSKDYTIVNVTMKGTE